jgi:hypothetical protein
MLLIPTECDCTDKVWGSHVSKILNVSMILKSLLLSVSASPVSASTSALV